MKNEHSTRICSILGQVLAKLRTARSLYIRLCQRPPGRPSLGSFLRLLLKSNPLPLLFSLAFAACSMGSASTAEFSTDPSQEEDNRVSDEDASTGSSAQDAASTFAPSDAGPKTETRSPLCEHSPASCNPEDLDACLIDGGKGACRFAATNDGSYDTTCQAAGAGVDGAQCVRSSDCAPGSECVGSGQCRAFCCDGRCDANGYCGIDNVLKSAIRIPVCFPTQPCKLLAHNCGAGQTCGIVSDNGVTSCIPIGTANVGESCDGANCADGLTCLGIVGSRVCHKLCNTAGTSASGMCAKGEKCKGSAPLFQEPGTGVCEKI